MLSKRANILFEEDLWLTLATLAQSREVSVGELVREAVRKAYLGEARQNNIAKAAAMILFLRQKQTGIDYKELVNYGRRE